MWMIFGGFKNPCMALQGFGVLKCSLFFLLFLFRRTGFFVELFQAFFHLLIVLLGNLEIYNINEEREIPGRPKVVRGSNVPVLTSHAGLNPRSKSGYEPERRVINMPDTCGNKISTKMSNIYKN